MDPRQRTASKAGSAALETARGGEHRSILDTHTTNSVESFVLFMFCSVKSYMSRVFPIATRSRTFGRFSLLLLSLSVSGCDQIGKSNPLSANASNPRVCGVPPWQGREAESDSDVVNRDLAVCLWEKSRLLADAPATNDELGRAIVGGCWDRVSAWGRVVSPASSMEEIDRVVQRLQLQSLYWVIEARAGNCRITGRRTG